MCCHERKDIEKTIDTGTAECITHSAVPVIRNNRKLIEGAFYRFICPVKMLYSARTAQRSFVDLALGFRTHSSFDGRITSAEIS